MKTIKSHRNSAGVPKIFKFMNTIPMYKIQPVALVNACNADNLIVALQLSYSILKCGQEVIKNKLCTVTFQVLTAMSMKITFFWDVTLHSLAKIYNFKVCNVSLLQVGSRTLSKIPHISNFKTSGKMATFITGY